MKVELRGHGLVLIAQSQEESALIDQCFGKAVAEDGLIGTSTCECRLSDGYGAHYILVKNVENSPESKMPTQEELNDIQRATIPKPV